VTRANEKILKKGHGLKIRTGGGSNPIAGKVTKLGYPNEKILKKGHGLKIRAGE